MEVWVHSPHLRQAPGFHPCSRRTISALFVIQLTVIVAVSIIYLPTLSERKYKVLVSTDDDILGEDEIHKVLGLDPSSFKDGRVLGHDPETRHLMSKLDSHNDVRVEPMPREDFPDLNQNQDLKLAAKHRLQTAMEDVSTTAVPKRKSKRRNRSKRRKKMPKKATQSPKHPSSRKKISKDAVKTKQTRPDLAEKSRDKKLVPTPGSKLLYSELYNKDRILEEVDLLVIVNTGLGERARRDAVRDTWFTECIKEAKVRCFFFTDEPGISGNKEEEKKIRKESKVYNDMVFQPMGGGLLFGHRMLFQLQWARSHFKFKFLLRVDDDVMLCLQHLLFDLKRFRQKNLQWGFLHCEQPELVYIDEGIIMFSSDVIDKYLSQNPAKIRCHPYGDQTIGLWIQDLGLDPYHLYVHDRRIHHDPPASYDKNLLQKTHLCNEYVALHGVYAGYMSEFWSRRGHPAYLKYDEPNTSYLCTKPFVVFWDKFTGKFFHQPSQCYLGDVWGQKNKVKQFHQGRERDIIGGNIPQDNDMRQMHVFPGGEPLHTIEDKKSWKYSEDVMDRPKAPPGIIKGR